MRFLKVISSIYLALLLLLQPVLPFIEYVIFKDYISEYLCINRFEENSCCKGKCFLEEQVKEANEQKPESQNKTLRIKTETVVFVLSNLHEDLDSFQQVKTQVCHYYNFYNYTFNFSVFHPPQAV